MKKIISVMLVICLVFAFAACKEGGAGDKTNAKAETASGGSLSKLKGADPTDPNTYTLDCMTSMGVWETPKSSDEIDKAASSLLKEIEGLPDTLKPANGGKYIYVANDGKDDKGNGYSVEKPVATIAYANLLAKAGDVVVLKRGNFWREHVTAVNGVSYGAYGKGNKPAIYGSPENFALREWELTDTPDVYRVAIGGNSNIGAVVFDHGVAVGAMKEEAEELENNYDYYVKTGYLYVYCTDGNPGALYANIEINVGGHIIALKSNSTVQNLRLMYTGGHGIGMGNGIKNVKIEGCVIGYIGGSSSSVGRLGNGVEIFGSCDGYTVRKCHVYQCYDAGVTMQYNNTAITTDIIEQNVLFEENLLEYSVYNVEYFLVTPKAEGSMIKNAKIKDNIMRFAGYGWGYYSRPDKNNGTHVRGTGRQNRAENLVFENNVFEHAKSFLISYSAMDKKYYPKFVGNTYAQAANARILTFGGHNYRMNRDGKEAMTDVMGDKTGKFVMY